MSSHHKNEIIKCPICFKNIDTICDNDCGTVYCCDKEFYYENDIAVFKHYPNCGQDSSIEDF
jgi:hypothetical protein